MRSIVEVRDEDRTMRCCMLFNVQAQQTRSSADLYLSLPLINGEPRQQPRHRPYGATVHSQSRAYIVKLIQAGVRWSDVKATHSGVSG